MTTTALNLPLYRVLRALQVSEPDAEAAAAAAPPDLTHLATKDELRAEIASVRADIAQTAQRQTTWLITVVLAAAGIVIAAQRLIPPALPTDAVRAIVEQTMRNFQPQPQPQSQPQPAPAPAAPPRAAPQP